MWLCISPFIFIGLCITVYREPDTRLVAIQLFWKSIKWSTFSKSFEKFENEVPGEDKNEVGPIKKFPIEFY